jgi:hypothetical protein
VLLVYLPCFVIGWIVGVTFLEEAESVSATLYTCFAEVGGCTSSIQFTDKYHHLNKYHP